MTTSLPRFQIRVESLFVQDFQNLCEMLISLLESTMERSLNESVKDEIKKQIVYCKAQSTTDKLIDRSMDLCLVNRTLDLFRLSLKHENLSEYLEFCEEKVKENTMNEQEYIEEGKFLKNFTETFEWIHKMPQNEKIIDVYFENNAVSFLITNTQFIKSEIYKEIKQNKQEWEGLRNLLIYLSTKE